MTVPLIDVEKKYIFETNVKKNLKIAVLHLDLLSVKQTLIKIFL
jgi:hypothetical protein